jgi:hypothetical protein
MATSVTFGNLVADRITDDAGYLMVPDTTYYISLHTASPATTGAFELAASYAYARAPYTSGATNWNGPTAGVVTNAGAITFTPAAGGTWATATHFGLWNDAAGTVSNFMFGGALTGSVVCNDGDAVQFQATKLEITVA